MKKTLLSTIFLFLLSLGVQAQMPNNRINWNPRPLTWQDFAGTPDPATHFHANTSSGLTYSWSMKTLGKQIDFIYEVGAFFSPLDSWVKPGKGSDHLLLHEQLHFDITELHARKLRKAMEEFDVKNAKDIKPSLQSLYKRTETERANMQKKFDAETRHSMDKEAQLRWQKFISDELKKLEKFSS